MNQKKLITSSTNKIDEMGNRLESKLEKFMTELRSTYVTKAEVVAYAVGAGTTIALLVAKTWLLAAIDVHANVPRL